MAENNILNDIATWYSILGLIISLITLWFAKSIKNAVRDAETKALFNTMSAGVLDDLKSLNAEFVRLLASNNEQEIKNILNKLKAQIVILSRYIPEDYRDECAKGLRMIESQYKSTIVFDNRSSKKFHFSFFKGEIKINDLWKTYNIITTIIDYVNNHKQEKEIIS